MVKCDFSNCGFAQKELEKTAMRLEDRFLKLRRCSQSTALSQSDDLFSLPARTDALEIAQHYASVHKDIDVLVVIGIGGSNLGAKAVIKALLGKFYHITSKKQILFAENCDPESAKAMKKVVENSIQEGKRVLVCAISKSGSTTETIANLEIILQTLSVQGVNPKDHVLVITDKGSKLDLLSKSSGFDVIYSPESVGGRYSVFSTVGLVPLAIAGIDIKVLLEGALQSTKENLLCEAHSSPAAISAASIYLNAKSGRQTFNQFIFSPDMESCGKWYRQLLAESSGKEWNIDGSARINAGITPMVSIGTTDLHSIAQLYLAGPRNTYFRFISYDEKGEHLTIPDMPHFEPLVQNIQGRETQDISDAILGGVQAAFAEAGLPFQQIRLKAKSPKSLGWLFQFQMAEVVLLCELLGVNPYDQPNVESYKQQTRKLLSQGI